jgi:hypothetical protein
MAISTLVEAEIMMSQHWRNARAAQFANMAGAQGTGPCPTGPVGAKRADPAEGSLWNSEELSCLLAGMDSLQHGGCIMARDAELFCRILGRSAHVYAKTRRYANWGVRSPAAERLDPSNSKIRNLAKHPTTGEQLCDPNAAKQALRRLYDKKKLTFIDEQVLQHVRSAAHEHRRYATLAKRNNVSVKDW